ncbi:MAG: hypothetical protein M5U22_07100 [Thermoleophilia bacterium]|nr:hypothetical protein [Thermoleophilia bacterium]
MAKVRSFLSEEKQRQAALKHDPELFTLSAQADGHYSARPESPRYPFCLPLDVAGENLFVGVRNQIEAFAAKGIPWHKGIEGGPTTHLCSSQVCCVNFLAPFASKPDALLALVRAHYQDATSMVNVDPHGRGDLVKFERIGNRMLNYLDEGSKRSGTRTRGANCTSADAAVRYWGKGGRSTSSASAVERLCLRPG